MMSGFALRRIEQTTSLQGSQEFSKDYSSWTKLPLRNCAAGNTGTVLKFYLC